MSRSGYVDDMDDPLQFGRWRAQVKSAIRGKRGQQFLRELAAAMDATPEDERRLIRNTLIDDEGCCCTIGVVCKARGIDVAQVDTDDTAEVGSLVGIAYQMAAEIEFMNDEFYDNVTPEVRWVRMREWVARQLVAKGVRDD